MKKGDVVKSKINHEGGPYIILNVNELGNFDLVSTKIKDMEGDYHGAIFYENRNPEKFVLIAEYRQDQMETFKETIKLNKLGG